MKKVFLIIIILIVNVILIQQTKAMPNPWVDCGADFECATKVSGITFPLRLSNYWIRAMHDMIEIGYPLDEFRDVEVRKTVRDFGYDISGVYTKYPVNKNFKLKNGIIVYTRGTFRKIYVLNMVTKNGFYSVYCRHGMSKKEALGVCSVVMDAENN